jgi:hypothetical protein
MANLSLWREAIESMQTATIGMFEEVDRQLVALARAATTPVAVAEPLPFIAAPPTAPLAEAVWLPPLPTARPSPRRVAIVAGLAIAVLGLGALATVSILHVLQSRTLTGKAAVDSVVTRILAAESQGSIDPATSKNKRSSAAGPAQFLDDTWLELIRAYRPDLVKNRTRDELLALRRKPGLAREIAMRFAERNAAVLKRHGLPVTPGTIYLAHFAGPAGAVALLSAPADADAAAVMAKADASGKMKREQIVKANPFLDKYTVADIRRWAERKMDGPTLTLTELFSANARK